MEQGPLISQCAESKVYEASFYGAAAVVKHRFAKGYRHPDLDIKLREQRTCREARALVRARKAGVVTPTVFAVDRSQCTITMERIEGLSARDFVKGCTDHSIALQVLHRIGVIVASLHENDIIHGDLTTSNFIIRDVTDTSSLVAIDFGLVRDSTSAEERAVDLYVLERAVMSAHPLLTSVEDTIMNGYMGQISAAKGKATYDRLVAVRARGRKRSMVG